MKMRTARTADGKNLDIWNENGDVFVRLDNGAKVRLTPEQATAFGAALVRLAKTMRSDEHIYIEWTYNEQTDELVDFSINTIH